MAEPDVLNQAERVSSICRAVSSGDFCEARRLLDRCDPKNGYLGQMEQIVAGHERIQLQRQSSRHAAYEKQLAELEAFKAGRKVSQSDCLAEDHQLSEGVLLGQEPSLSGDPNAAGGVLAVIARAHALADERQKARLLADPFVQDKISHALAHAGDLTAKARWLDAYTECYYWLQVLQPDEKSYQEQSEELLEMVNIVAAFQDSPCETSRQRYEGIRDRMFTRAVDALRFNYVSVIDYGQMAVKALQRCMLVCRVLGSSAMQQKDGFEDFVPPEEAMRKACTAGLAAMLEDVKRLPTGLDRQALIDVFEKTLKLNDSTVRIPRELLTAQFTEAALSALDPYTVMVWPRQVEDFDKMMTNEFTGIGIEITKEKGMLTVASLLPDTPAYASGLDAGDAIVKVDGVDTKEMSLMCAVKTITGPKGTTVTLTARGPGDDETRDITITRAGIRVPTVRGWQRTAAGRWLHMIDQEEGIGYIRVTGFSEKTADDVEHALDQLEAAGMKALVLDLRFNSGGLLDSAVAIADKFLLDGLIVSTRPRGIGTWAIADSPGTHPDYPLVILINSASASASEIVAGALADGVHKRAILVGERTHGKGSVQGITPYPQGGAQLKYTMAYYHLPSGQRVESREMAKKRGSEDWGIAPHVRIELTGEELKEMLDVQRGNDVLVKADHRDTAPLDKHPVKDTIAADLQLAVAILVAKSELVKNNMGVLVAGSGS